MFFNWDKFLSPKPSLDVPALETVDLNDKEMEKRIVRKQDLRIMPWTTSIVSTSETQRLSTMTRQSTTSSHSSTSPAKNTTSPSLSSSYPTSSWNSPATFFSSTFRRVNGFLELWCLGALSPSALLRSRHMAVCWL
ncbi:hypothetical protein LB505_001145 [Fusarium chuoi]|nr:hypothetical protein LB505_001145 [Fusarium chuoi]